MIHSKRPLVEKITFFWHGHFATAQSKVNNPYAMYLQNQLMREHGLGLFEDLLQRISRDQAMLIYLDGSANRKAHPNENYAREVMELFTIGIGHYTEEDVKEGARAFTGWSLNNDAFNFNANEHDAGPKKFLGHEGKLDGTDVIKSSRSTRSRRSASPGSSSSSSPTRSPTPRRSRHRPVWVDTHGDVREVLRAIFLSPAFSSEKAAYRARIKSPAEYVIGAIRGLGGAIAPRQAVGVMARMGRISSTRPP